MSPVAIAYAGQLDKCEVPAKQRGVYRVAVGAVVKAIRENEARYRKVYDATGVPWMAVGILHSAVCGLDFTRHLCNNGALLTACALRVPKGRSWEKSAITAFKLAKLDEREWWHRGVILENFEKHNNLRYLKKSVSNPFLWGYTDQYIKGEYDSKGRYDPELVSEQIGCAAIMKALGV